MLFIIPNTNLAFCGFGMTKNGCKIVKLKFLNEKRGFSIETNTPEMANVHAMSMPISHTNLYEMRMEIVKYIQANGTKRQCNSLRVVTPQL